jgi:hypothetical protein
MDFPACVLLQSGPAVRFVRVGTMDNPDLSPPDIHIITLPKKFSVMLRPGIKAVPEFHVVDEV